MLYLLPLIILALFIWYLLRTTPRQLMERIDRRCQGLKYVSEIDAPVSGYLFKGPMDEWLDLFSTYEEVPFGDWMELRGESWLGLWDYLDERIESPIVIKTGTINRDIYAVGTFRGAVVGVRTRAVET